MYESLDAVGVRPDTTITNAAISACDKGGAWEAALALFRLKWGMVPVLALAGGLGLAAGAWH